LDFHRIYAETIMPSDKYVKTSNL